jgi:UDP-arabinose 4-epimerase
VSTAGAADRPSLLVTGGAGYIGSHVCKTLSQAGFLPVTLDNLATGHPWAVKWGPIEVGDVRDSGRVETVMRRYRVTAVVHLAALSLVGADARQPIDYYDINVNGALSVALAMRACTVRRLVFSSSCSVYGLPQEMPITEAAPTLPVNVYGRTKLAAENLFSDLARAGEIDVSLLRYFNAAGADRDGEIGEAHEPESHLIPLAIRAALDQGPPLSVFGTDYPTPDGTCLRDYVHVEDLATAHLQALRYLETKSGVHAFNLGTGKPVSVREILAAVARSTGRPVPAADAPRRQGDPAQVFASAEKARRELGWIPASPGIDAMVASALNWHRKYQNAA